MHLCSQARRPNRLVVPFRYETAASRPSPKSCSLRPGFHAAVAGMRESREVPPRNCTSIGGIALASVAAGVAALAQGKALRRSSAVCPRCKRRRQREPRFVCRGCRTEWREPAVLPGDGRGDPVTSELPPGPARALERQVLRGRRRHPDDRPAGCRPGERLCLGLDRHRPRDEDATWTADAAKRIDYGYRART